jgi:hypothetical protein
MQTAATCSRWFLARGFFYPEDGGDTFSETSVHTRSGQRHIPEDGIVHSHRRENLKSYILNTVCTQSTSDVKDVVISLKNEFLLDNVEVFQFLSYRKTHITVTETAG